jgi:hypothetical protein
MSKKAKPGEPLIDAMMRMAYEHAERVLVKHGDERTSLVPIFAVMARGELSIVATPWTNDGEKRMAQMLVRAKIKLDHADAYSFVSEAWMLAVDKSEYPNPGAYDGIMPSQSERRVEVVCATAVAKTDSGLDKRFMTWTIVRNGSGRIVALTPMPEPYQGSDNVAGTMTTLLDD